MVRDGDEAALVANRFAAEHVNLAVSNPDALLLKVRHAGEVFLGDTTPVASGDYYAGPSHCLPTGTTARFTSGISVYTFLKRTGTVAYRGGMPAKAIEHIAKMAEAEGLDGHAHSVKGCGVELSALSRKRLTSWGPPVILHRNNVAPPDRISIGCLSFVPVEGLDHLLMHFQRGIEHQPVGFADGGAGGGEAEGAQGEEAFAQAEVRLGVLNLFQQALEDQDAQDPRDGDDAAVGQDVDAGEPFQELPEQADEHQGQRDHDDVLPAESQAGVAVDDVGDQRQGQG